GTGISERRSEAHRSYTDFVPLVAYHEIVYAPSASAIAILRGDHSNRRPAPKSIAVLADPVFSPNDERLEAPEKPHAPSAVSAGNREPSEESLGGSASLSPVSVRLGFEQPSPAESVIAGAGSGAPRPAPTFPRLFSTRAEADEIMSIVSADQGMKALDFMASRELATSGELG